MYKAVIFDRDGVLVDSEYTNIKSSKIAFKELGINITDDEKKLIVGRHPDDFLISFHKKYNFDDEKFKQLQKENYRKIFKTTSIFNQTINFLKKIHQKNIPIAICTSSKKESTLELLNRIGIKNLFKYIITKEDYSKRKPNPEPYLVTAQKLNLKPKECLVIEDSQIGLESALNAGMDCIIIFNKYTKDSDFSGAKLVVNSANKINIDELFN